MSSDTLGDRTSVLSAYNFAKRIRWWEIVVTTRLALLAVLWIAGGLLVPGLVLPFLLAFAVASKSRDRGALLFVGDQRDWTGETSGTVAAFALARHVAEQLEPLRRAGLDDRSQSVMRLVRASAMTCACQAG